ncbi:GTPase regulator Nrf1 [Microbotryomycetes sp. JL201]|nr:GTPase regulator Nrf1 [Microbotryomycetes sp. JL201]
MFWSCAAVVVQVIAASAPAKQQQAHRVARPRRAKGKSGFYTHMQGLAGLVFFANERTFLSWLNFTVVLGGLAVGLLNFGDRVGKISAGMFTFVSMAIMIYALVTYHWRAAAIRKRGSGPYDDRVGPTVLCLALLAAIVINFILRFTA